MTPTSSFVLHSLKVEGLLSFGEETSFEFGRLNILVGPNGAGKSNLIDCLRVFKNCPLDIQETFKDAGFEEWLFRGGNTDPASLKVANDDLYGLLHGVVPSSVRTDVPASLEVLVQLPKHSGLVSHGLRLGPTFRSTAQLAETIQLDDTNHLHPDPLVFFQIERGRPVVAYREPDSQNPYRLRVLSEDEFQPFQSILAQLRDVQRYPQISRLAEFYSNLRIYSEWSFGRGSSLRESTPADRSDTYLSESMDDLALALNGLQGSSAHDKIRTLLRELKDSYRDYITRVIFGRVGLELKETPFDRPLPAKRLSDGTLRFLALAAILLNPEPSPLICLEEPELGMHPDMIRLVANMIAEASQRTQLIVTTHSEHLITALEDDFDALFSFDSGVGGSCVRRFSRDDFQGWRDQHRLGELWTSGELGGNRW